MKLKKVQSFTLKDGKFYFLNHVNSFIKLTIKGKEKFRENTGLLTNY